MSIKASPPSLTRVLAVGAVFLVVAFWRIKMPEAVAGRNGRVWFDVAVGAYLERLWIEV